MEVMIIKYSRNSHLNFINPLMCFQVSLKSLQIYDEYGVSKDPLQLQGQVRELKVQLENQTKLILQMQSLLRRSSLASDLVANTSDPLAIKDQEGTQREDHGQDRSNRSGQLREKKEGDNQAMKDKTSRLNVELERESTLNRSMSDQLQQTRSRSTSPARSTVFYSVLSRLYYFYIE